jgi:hypothetical protein
MRRIAERAVAIAITAALPSAAAAQHHHGGGPGAQVHAGVSAEMGSVEFLGGDRDYQGLAVSAGVRLASVELAAHVPFYRIELGGEWGSGPGDPHLEARWVARVGGLELGPSVAVMPPLGDDADGLGMGHWMIMAGGTARATRGRLLASASLGYGGSPGGGDHAEHGGGVWPPVAPMNAHEIEAALHARVALGRGFGVAAALSGAAPLGDGDLLALAGLGATVHLGMFELGVGLGHGLLDHPAALRATTHVMASF